MRAVVYDAPGELTVREVPTPEPGPGEVRVKVLQAGLCGTDLHLHDGQFLAAYPMTPGHEVVGVVDRLGPQVDGLEVGEQVVVNPNISCGSCSFCREGRGVLCRSFAGLGSTLPGGFADYEVAPAGQVFSAAGLDPDVAVLAEPTACVMHGVRVLRPTPGSTALVIGSGPSGLLLAQLVAHGGAVHVTVASPVDYQLRTAEALGVDATFLMDRSRLPEDVAALLELSGGQGYDVVIDATGVASVIEASVGLVRSGGTAMFYGVADEEARVQLSPYEIFRRQLTIRGSFTEVDTFPAALAALRSGRVRTGGLITHRFRLEDYAEALKTLRSGKRAHKIVITP